ncbi:hypothetical protein MRX96_014883 [Rhipicephalus microplus]
MMVLHNSDGGGVGARSITVNETLFARIPLRWVVGPPKAQLFDARAALIRRGLIGFVNDHLVRTEIRARPARSSKGESLYSSARFLKRLRFGRWITLW